MLIKDRRVLIKLLPLILFVDLLLRLILNSGAYERCITNRYEALRLLDVGGYTRLFYLDLFSNLSFYV
jgi:hypothetical protein